MAWEGAVPARPLRILVLGNSIPLMIKPTSEPRVGMNYVEWLRELLPQRGIEAVVVNRARWYGVITDVHSFDTLIRQQSPDLVIVHYGLMEAWPRPMPVRLHRAVNEWMIVAPVGLFRRRRAVAHAIWPALREWQRRFAASSFGRRQYLVTPERFRAELVRLIQTVRRDVGGRVVLVDLSEVNPVNEYWIPGTIERQEAMQEVLEQVAAESDATTLVSLRGLVRDHGSDIAPDGVHLSAAGHRAFAEGLADHIAALRSGPPRDERP